MKTLITLICMMAIAHAQPKNNNLEKEIDNMDKVERTMRSAPPQRMGGRQRR